MDEMGGTRDKHGENRHITLKNSTRRHISGDLDYVGRY
jgi:hypothetical protein